MKGVSKLTGKSPRFIDRVGQRTGRLLFTKNLGEDKHRHTVWQALCDCGNETTTSTPSKTMSCGCIRKEMMSALGSSSRLPDGIREIRYKESRNRTYEKRRSDPLHLMHSRISRLFRHALSSINAIKTSPTLEMLGFTVDEFVIHIEKQFLKGMSWENINEWQIDHIIPISSAKTVDDVVRLNQLSNLRPLWSKENNKKKNKILTLL